MRRRKFFIVLIAMMLFAVQGYAQRGRHYHPAPRHHHHVPYCGYSYYPYFSTWDWYGYGGYTSRYMYYRGCYFDSLLGYYIYGALDSPSEVKIEGLSFSRRSNGTLRVKNGTEPVSYLDLYRQQTLRYTYRDGRTIEVTTGGGYATIDFYDQRGNSASYRL